MYEWIYTNISDKNFNHFLFEYSQNYTRNYNLATKYHFLTDCKGHLMGQIKIPNRRKINYKKQINK